MVNVKFRTREDTHETQLDAARVGEVLELLRREHKGLQDVLVKTMNGTYITVVKVNGEDTRFGRHLNTPLEDGDTVEVEVVPQAKDRVLREYYLTFAGDSLGQPVLYSVGNMFGAIVNIKGASISARRGFAHVELEGPKSEVDAVIEFFAKNGITVENPDATAGEKEASGDDMEMRGKAD